MNLTTVEVTTEGGQIETRELPLIDLGAYLDGDDAAKADLAGQLRYASETVGFLALKNHGISEDLLNRAVMENIRFSSLPMDEKLKIQVNEHQRGYIQPRATRIKHSTYHDNSKFDLNETTVFATDYGPDNPHVQAGKQFYSQNLWPENLPGFRQVVEEYMTTMETLGKSLLPLWAMALDLPEDFFNSYFEKNYTYYRMAHYPPKPEADDNEFALGAHADTGFMTLLPSADVEGLEILDANDIWFRPKKIPGIIHVNIGQFFERWSNERFRATPHRVAIPKKDHRYTVPVFVNPDFEMVANCLPTCHNQDNPQKYPSESYWDFFKWYMSNSYTHYEEFHEED